jgi:ferritin-like metal-binding protein YciE
MPPPPRRAFIDKRQSTHSANATESQWPVRAPARLNRRGEAPWPQNQPPARRLRLGSQAQEKPMPKLKSARDILVNELKEIHSAERQLSRAMPKIMKRIDAAPLKQKLEERQQQGEMLIEGLDQAFEQMEMTKARPKNVAVEGFIEDINQHLEQIDDPQLLDPVILASLQKVEHYCIAAWGTARSLAQRQQEQKIVQLMERALDEGKRFDEEMTELAEQEINPAMERELEPAE